MRMGSRSVGDRGSLCQQDPASLRAGPGMVEPNWSRGARRWASVAHREASSRVSGGDLGLRGDPATCAEKGWPDPVPGLGEDREGLGRSNGTASISEGVAKAVAKTEYPRP